MQIYGKGFSLGREFSDTIRSSMLLNRLLMLRGNQGDPFGDESFSEGLITVKLVSMKL